MKKNIIFSIALLAGFFAFSQVSAKTKSGQFQVQAQVQIRPASPAELSSLNINPSTCGNEIGARHVALSCPVQLPEGSELVSIKAYYNQNFATEWTLVRLDEFELDSRRGVYNQNSHCVLNFSDQLESKYCDLNGLIFDSTRNMYTLTIGNEIQETGYRNPIKLVQIFYRLGQN